MPVMGRLPCSVIFLDIDGVLNGHQFSEVAESCSIDPACVAEFNRLLLDTGAGYVVSSAWRYMIHGDAMTELGFEYMLRTHGVMAGRMLGYTNSDEAVRDGRESQIKRWMRKYGYDHPYVAIDDLPLKGIRAVRTDGKRGLTWMGRIQAELLLRVQRSEREATKE